MFSRLDSPTRDRLTEALNPITTEIRQHLAATEFNTARVKQAAVALFTYSLVTSGLFPNLDDEEGTTEIMGDLLGDLRHLCADIDIDHDDADTRGHEYYIADVAEG